MIAAEGAYVDARCKAGISRTSDRAKTLLYHADLKKKTRCMSSGWMGCFWMVVLPMAFAIHMESRETRGKRTKVLTFKPRFLSAWKYHVQLNGPGGLLNERHI